MLLQIHQTGFCKITGRSGSKYFKNYSPQEYKREPQNWCILQDNRGVIYAANQGGILEFDGTSWRTIEVPHKSVRSIAINEKGTVYVGGINELGCLTPDPMGVLKYVSLVEYLEDNHKNFSTVFSTDAAGDGIYFFTEDYLFRWNSREMKVWKPKPRCWFEAAFNCNGKYFIHQNKNVGLMNIVDGSLKLVPGNETFAAAYIYMMAPFETNSQKLLIGTRKKGFYVYDGMITVPFHTEADDYLKEKKLCHGIRLSSGDFAMATRLGGIVIIDPGGNLKHIFDTSYGLPDNNVKHISQDFQGNLWLGLNKGITKIEYASPISIYDNRSSLTSLVLSVGKHNDKLYVGAYNELYVFSSTGEFKIVQGISSTCWSILSTGDYLLAATTRGLFQVGNKTKSILIKSSSQALVQSKRDKKRIWVGKPKGLISLYRNRESSQWQVEHKFENITQPIKTIVEDQKGNLWLGLRTKDVLKVDFQGGEVTAQPIVTRYDKAHGLPDRAVRVFMVKDHVIFATDNGLYRFNEKKRVFVPDSTLGDQFAGGEDGRPVFRMAEDREENIWLHSDHMNIQAIPQPDGSFVIDEKPFLTMPLGQANAIYPDPDGNTIWFATNDGLIRYDKRFKKDYDLDFSTIIRKVLVNGKLVFDGHQSKQPFPIPIIDYKDRHLRFQFAAPFFEGETETRYRTLLEGYEDKWSDWTPEPQKEYTNLNSGLYTFRVQARNVYEHVGREAAFQFKILPPWYMTWWAFLGYAIAAFLGVFFIVKWRSGKLKREKEKLEHIVIQRTKEINEKNVQLESQTVQLKEQSEKLKEMDNVKSRFFANISHEFRTPLTLLMGPLEQMIADCGDDEKEKKRKLTMMLRNAQRLLRLINQLLELSKLDSGKMKLQAVKTNIVSFIKGIIDSFRFLAHEKELDLVFQIENGMEAEDIFLYIDPRKMEDVMSNLLINAVKFTPAGGKISITLSKSFCGGAGGSFLEKSPLPAGGKKTSFVQVSVCDTGPGIPAEQLPYIFNRFYQADSTYEHHQKGSGIGLALSKELVELHHGTVEAGHCEGGGSEFIIRLPMGSAHLATDELGVPTNAGAEEITTREIAIEEEKENESDAGAGAGFHLETAADEANVILVVEDSADMRDYIRGALEPVYTVVDAGDGKEGIEKALEIIPDLIVSDIMMPEKDGYELCRVLKSDVRTSHVPMILLTAKAAEENIVEGLETGADDYITKPFSTKILLARIKNLIDIRRQLQKNLNRAMALQPVKTSVSKIDKEFLRDLQEVIAKNISEPEFNVEDLCKRLYMGNTTLYRKIRALCGQTPTEFIRSCRLKRAAQLLKSGFGSVTEVAFEVGFSSRTYFTKCFKERFNQLPSSYASIGGAESPS